jgi:excisionase family DNA binding protein
MEVVMQSATEMLAEGALGMEEARRFSGMGRTFLYAAMDRGDLPYTKVGRRRLIPRRALIAFLARNLTARDDRWSAAGE